MNSTLGLGDISNFMENVLISIGEIKRDMGSIQRGMGDMQRDISDIQQDILTGFTSLRAEINEGRCRCADNIKVA